MPQMDWRSLTRRRVNLSEESELPSSITSQSSTQQGAEERTQSNVYDNLVKSVRRRKKKHLQTVLSISICDVIFSEIFYLIMSVPEVNN